MLVLDGREPSRKMMDCLKEEVEKIKRSQGWQPCLATIQIGEDPAAAAYLRSQRRACERVGFEARRYLFAEGVALSEVQTLLRELSADETVDAVMVERPLPTAWDLAKLMDLVDPVKDVEGVHRSNLGSLYLGDYNASHPCTAQAIMTLLSEYHLDDLKGKNASVIGVSPTVGKAVAMLLLHRRASVTLLHSQSRSAEVFRALDQADVVVVGIGKPRMITGDLLKKGAVVIDVGINILEDGSIVGDVDWESLQNVALAATPVPGGVGPLTVASLMENVLYCAKKRRWPPFGVASQKGADR